MAVGVAVGVEVRVFVAPKLQVLDRRTKEVRASLVCALGSPSNRLRNGKEKPNHHLRQCRKPSLRRHPRILRCCCEYMNRLL